MKQSWHAALVCTTLMLTGCGNKHEEAARQAVLKNLNDPSSAQFSDITVYDTGAVCGNVNAKNRMGGYAGPSAFVYNGSSAGSVSLNASQYEQDDWCQDIKPRIETLEKLCSDIKASSHLRLSPYATTPSRSRTSTAAG